MIRNNYKGRVATYPQGKFGVYGILHVKSNRMYIGGASFVSTRFAFHVCALRRGIHKCKELQQFWRQDGEEAFRYILLERCLNVRHLRDREQWWHEQTPNSLNTMKGVSPLGFRPGPSIVGKLAAKRRWANPEYRAKQEATVAHRKRLKAQPARSDK